MITPLANPTNAPASDAGDDTPATIPALSMTMAAMQPDSAAVEPTDRSKPPPMMTKRHAHGDDRHDRGLHQNVGEVERRQKTVGQQRVNAHNATSVISGT